MPNLPWSHASIYFQSTLLNSELDCWWSSSARHVLTGWKRGSKCHTFLQLSILRAALHVVAMAGPTISPSRCHNSSAQTAGSNDAGVTNQSFFLAAALLQRAPPHAGCHYHNATWMMPTEMWHTISTSREWTGRANWTRATTTLCFL